MQGHLSSHSAGVDPKEKENPKNEIEFKQKKMFSIKLGLIKLLENAVIISWNWFIVKMTQKLRDETIRIDAQQLRRRLLDFGKTSPQITLKMLILGLFQNTFRVKKDALKSS